MHCVDLGESFPIDPNSNEYLLAKFGFRSFRSIAQPGSRAKKTNVKKPRKSKVVASDGGAHSKKSKKPRKERRKAGPTEGS